MLFYRSLLVATAALALALPAFADEVPAGAEQAAQPVAEGASLSEQTKIDLNKATVKELTKIKGVTPTKAKAIVAYRKKNGDFKSVEELKNVKGFKKMNAEQIKEIQDQLMAN